MPSITTDDLEWCANWTQDDRYYCTVFVKSTRYSKPRGFHNFLENLFGKTYGGFRYDNHRNGYECWFRTHEDMITFKLVACNGNKR